MPFDTAPAARTQRCSLCPSATACLISGASREDAGRWEACVESQIALPTAGKTLVEAGAPVAAVYTVRAGCLKAFTVDADGTERVRAFYLPGDVVGLDALGGEQYPATIVAVVPSQVCKIPAAAVRRVIADSPFLARRLFDRMSADLSHALTLAGDYTAEQRLAAFLLSMRERLGAPDGALKLPMSRRDIANHLRLATETVCRVLGRLEAQGRIKSDSKTVRLVDPRALRATAFPALAAA